MLISKGVMRGHWPNDILSICMYLDKTSKRRVLADGTVAAPARPCPCPGVLPESNPESVLEDLVSADRYRLLGMKRVCQSMLRLSADSCLQVRGFTTYDV